MIAFDFKMHIPIFKIPCFYVLATKYHRSINAFNVKIAQ